MKKLLLFALCACGISLFAAEKANPVSYFQIGIWYNFPRSQMNSDVYGIKTGWPMCAGAGSITGIEASWLGSLTHDVNGMQLGWTVAYSKKVYGLQATLITCINRERLIGLQAAPVFAMAGDVTGAQASCVNVSGNVTGFQPAAIVNVSKDVTGLQMSTVTNVAGNVSGMQTSLINCADEGGFQLGLINVAKSGFQFGLLNFMDNGFLRFFPLVNFGCAK